MSDSATPILDLEVPAPTQRVAISATGLLKAVPAAIGVIVLIPAAIYVKFALGFELPQWVSSLVFTAMRTIERMFQGDSPIGILLMWLAIFLTIVIHELGHALTATALSWPLIEIRVVPFSLHKQSKSWKVRIVWTSLPLAMVGANPALVRLHSKVRIFALAGPIANLIAAALMLPLILISTLGSITSAFVELFMCWSLVVGFTNLLPLHVHGLELDGYVAFVVSRRPKLLARRIAAMKMNNHVRSGKPLQQLNQRWVALAEEDQRVSIQNRLGLWLAYSYWADRDQYERAATILEKLLRDSQHSDKTFRSVLFAEAAVISALRRRKAVASEWQKRAVAFQLPDLVLHRCACCVAWANGDMPEAFKRWQLTREAGVKLEDKPIRERFLESWDRWLKQMQESTVVEAIPSPL